MPGARRLSSLFLAVVSAFAAAPPLLADGPGPSRVSVDHRRLVVERRQPDGSLTPPEIYAMHGVVWAPASRSTDGNTASRRQAFADWYLSDVPEMSARRVDTVRLYLDPGVDATGRAVLDELWNHGIMAVVTVDEGTWNLARIVQVVEAYRDHPAILLWLIGNEWNLNLYYDNPDCSSIESAAICTEQAASLIHSLDSFHPVATSYGDIDVDADGLRLADTARYVQEVAPSVDVWALNLYRGSDFGTVFSQWRSISHKPMFIAELGTDALKMPEALPDEAMQAQWDLCLWHDLMVELSSLDPRLTCLGGTPFEWNDEWWKVQPSGAQNSGGFEFLGGHPDDFANEEYFGLLDIDRQERLAVQLLSLAFEPSYRRPPAGGLVLGVSSRGAAAAQYGGQYGYSRFYRCGRPFYNKTGGGGGGRGVNAVVLEPTSGAEIAPPTHFDTYATRSQCAANDPGAAMYALVEYLNAAPAGSLVLLSVADEAGLTHDNSCTPYSTSSCYASGLAALASLGSQMIGDYCFRDSWAMIAVKGAGAVAEGRETGAVVELHAGLPDPGSFTLSTDKAGSGSGSLLSDPAGIDCASGCGSDAASFPSHGLTALSAVPAADSWFAGWTGSDDCGDGILWMDRDLACTATFEPGCAPEPVELAYHDVLGEETYQACSSLTAGDGFEVTTSGQLKLRAGERVGLADGFSIHPGGRLTVIIDPALLPPP